MKKLFSVLLSLTLLLSVSVFAVTTPDPGGQSSSKDVTATYQSSATDTPVYSVDITWGSMEFVYSVANRTWNPETHTYIDGSGSWNHENGANLVTITNHSNKDITCNLSFSSKNDSISGTLSPPEHTLPSAEGKDLNAFSLTGSTTLSLDGSLEDTIQPVTVGTVLITISANE